MNSKKKKCKHCGEPFTVSVFTINCGMHEPKRLPGFMGAPVPLDNDLVYGYNPDSENE